MRVCKRRAELRASGETFVYFVRDQSGYIKIGVSNNPERRLAAMQTSHAAPLTLLAVMPGTRFDEAGLHVRFSHLRRTGEWFAPGKELMDYILAFAVFVSDESATP
jgi:hypothetical protein